MTNDMSDVLIRMPLIERFAIIDHPEKFHDCFILDRLELNPLSDILSFEVSLVVDFWELFVLDLHEKWQQLFFHVFYGHR